MTLNTIYVFSYKDVLLKTKAKIIHTLVFSIITCGCESGTVKRLIGKKLIHLETGVGESFMDTLDHQKDEKVHIIRAN